MNFGIMAMQMDALIPTGAASDDVIAQVMGFDHAGLIRKLHGTGFNLIELGGDMNVWFPNSFSEPAVAGLLQAKEELGLQYTVHLPLWSVEPSTPLGPVRLGSVQALADVVNATKPLDPQAYVLHATGALAAEFYQMRLPEMGKQLVLRQFQRNAMQSIKQLIAETGIFPRKLAVETIEFPFELTLEMAEELDLSICLDTGHVLVGFSGNVGLFEALDACLPRLAEVHLHDGPWQGLERKIGYGKDHQPLGKGDLDVANFLDRLAEARFSGPIIFELSVKEALESLGAIRAVRPQYLP